MLAGLRRSRMKLPQADLAVCPALVAVVWLILGILLALGPCSGLPAARLLATSGAVAFLVALRPSRLRWFALLLPLGAGLAVLHAAAPWRTYPPLLPRPVCRVWLRGHSITPAAARESGTQVGCRVAALRTWADPAWQPCRGVVLLRLPVGTELPPYGAGIEAVGTLRPPPPPPPGSLFNYPRLLWKRGIVDMVEVESVSVAKPAGWRAVIGLAYRLRAHLAEALGRGVPDPVDQAVVQAMALGYRQRLPEATRGDFLASGTIHVFAISGLHVGIVALLGGWLLATLGVPLRGRCLVLVPMVGAYVFMCGAAPSAVRSWLMLSCWWVARTVQRPPVPVNAVAAAALLALLWRPLALLETGFLFSFAVVVVLIVGWPLVSRLVVTLGERVWWSPPAQRRHRLERWRLRPARWLAGSGLAWFGSAGMVATANGLFVPAGIVLNVGVMALATLIIGGAAIKVLVSLLGWGFGEQLLGMALGGLARALRGLAGLGSGGSASWRICPLPPVLAVVYYLLVFAALRRLQPRRVLLLSGAVVLLLLPTLMAHCRGGRDVIVAGADATAPALVARVPGLSPVVVNTAGTTGAQRLAAELEQGGVNGLESLVLTGGGWGVAAGADDLVARWPVRSLVVPPGYLQSGSLRRAVARQEARGGRVRLLAPRTPAAWVGPLRVELAGRAEEQELQLATVAGPLCQERGGFALRRTGEACIRSATGGGWQMVTVPRQSVPFVLRGGGSGE